MNLDPDSLYRFLYAHRREDWAQEGLVAWDVEQERGSKDPYKNSLRHVIREGRLWVVKVSQLTNMPSSEGQYAHFKRWGVKRGLRRKMAHCVTMLDRDNIKIACSRAGVMRPDVVVTIIVLPSVWREDHVRLRGAHLTCGTCERMWRRQGPQRDEDMEILL